MKKITFLYLTFMSIVSLVNAAVTLPVTSSTFFATSAVNANTTDLEVGSTSALKTWYLIGTANGASPTISTNDLTYSNYVDNSVGTKIALLSTITAARTSWFQLTSAAADLPGGGTTYYLSFLLNVSSAPSSYQLLLNFINVTTSGGARGRIQIKANAASGAIGYYLQPLVYASGGVVTSLIPFNTSHLIVMKYVITTASSPANTTNGTATVTIFVDPTIGATETSSTSTVTETSIANLDCIKSLVINQQPGLGAQIAGLRFSTSWADVCKASAAPKLTTPTTSAATSLSSTGFTANWTAVANASSYDVKVYQNGTYIKTTNASGQSASSVAITGLSNFLTYTYTVTAKGDVTNYGDSDPSAAQSATTLDPNTVASINANFADGTWSAIGSSYANVSTNGFDFALANLNNITYYGSKGESHSTNVGLDNKTNGGKMTLPTVNSVAQIEIHALTGTAERTFALKEFNKTTGAYDLVATYTYNTASKIQNLDSVYIINISRTSPTKFRIENSGYGGMNVMQVIVRSSATTLISTPTVNSVTNIIGGGFTANWNTVANATGYRIVVTGSGKVRYVYTASGQSTSSYNVTGTDSISSARVRVSALCDGDVNYSDSYLSLSSAAFSVLKSQTITFATPTKTYGDADFAPATTSSDLTPSYASSNTAVATIESGNIHIVGAGTSTITASQSGNLRYNAAADVAQTLTVNKVALTIGAPSIASKQYDGTATAGTVTAGALSGFIGSETVSVNTAIGTYPDANVGIGKSATIVYTLTNGTGGGLAANYSLANGNATGDITAIPTTLSGNLGTQALLAGSDIAVSSTLVVDNPVTVHSITVAPGAKLTISANLTTTNGITLQSNASGTATMLNSGTYTGTITAEQYLGTARNWYVSSPVLVTNSPSNNITRYYEYVEAGNNDPSGQPTGSTVYWKGLSTGTAMTVGKGYISQANAETTVSFSGTPNNGTITTIFDLTRDDAKGKGFNLVGNPYPSYIDWSLVAGANTNLMSTAWFKTKKTDIAGGTYTFASVNVATPLSLEIVANNANTTITKYIPPMQAFWVRVKSGTASTNMSFTNAMREHRLNTGDVMKAPKLNERKRLRLQLINGSETDETLVYFDANATNDYNDFDSPKMMNNSATTPDLYSNVGNERLVINGLNAVVDNMELPLGFSLNAAATLKLKATQLSNFAEGTK
ncbi:MAG: hypothetical protein GZ091_10790, partial [Paludibacter sp.]|nr:hypothetical protein [Paludibacter sp.]